MTPQPWPCVGIRQIPEAPQTCLGPRSSEALTPNWPTAAKGWEDRGLALSFPPACSPSPSLLSLSLFGGNDTAPPRPQQKPVTSVVRAAAAEGCSPQPLAASGMSSSVLPGPRAVLLAQAGGGITIQWKVPPSQVLFWAWLHGDDLMAVERQVIRSKPP